ncbi:peptide chain release factor N(5)-glutamine methyltransferase [Paenibacillus lutrae]|uniref:Release factor glutamine methyltransferase n=1 Tax=Paenibacillus lutrae TaxID=2078573 RepID=A0A7X3K1S0_9BACL|nr:peptide chain release factor N(5)-glutamine methyltransferase [Paenibacillus lutrae]MVP02589.1 peptide chain release factor N(5)-glutamine methyltransferase [Paenibacillus lutrae]
MKRLEIKAVMTIREAYSQASSFLKEKQIQDASICAEILLQHVLGWSRTQFFLAMEEPFPAAHLEQWREVIERKAAGEPVQYITGEQDFFGLTLQVTDAVLIPRPETELLVEEILREGSRLYPQGAPLLADIGTGSGAIPVSLLHARPDWRAAACDLSPEALKVAQGNARRCGVAERIAFYDGDLLQPCIDRGLAIDILVSNPPYIPAGDAPGLQPEVRDYEPHLALFGGDDGLDLYRRLCGQIPMLAKQPKLVGLEVGIYQAGAVADMLRAAGDWSEIRFVKDLAGIDRHVLAIGAVD